MNKPKSLEGRPLIFGEVLFDRFPDGTDVLGGAPFNVAWHLQGFGCDPLFMSRVGDDEAGQTVRQAMQTWGLDTGGLQGDPTYPTGIVTITFEGDKHTFNIHPNQAYDHIDEALCHDTMQIVAPALLYHGSLILRTEKVSHCLENLLSSSQMPVFIDINLRDPWWRPEDLPLLLNRARWVKINDEELTLMASHLKFGKDTLKETAQRFLETYELNILIVTLGENGALAIDSSGNKVNVKPEKNIKVVDTVGAGDSFSAVVLLGLLQHWPLQLIMERAQKFASRICTQRGATSPDHDLYKAMTEAWGLSGL